MNCIELVENGSYDRKKLKKDDQEFIRGMEFVSDEVIDMALDLYLTENAVKNTGTINKLISEQARAFAEALKEYIYAQKCDMIVTMLEADL